MGIAITDEHLALQRVARAFLTERQVLEAARTVADAAAETIPEFWKDLATLGWLGLHVPEEYGGSGATIAELAVVLDELGRVAAPGPFLPTVLASAVLVAAGTTDQRAAYLPTLVDGSRVATVALHSALDRTENALDGDAGLVMAAGIADLLLLPIGTDLVVVDRDAPGLTIRPERSLDLGRRVARVTCTGVRIDAARVVPHGRIHAARLAPVLAAAEAAGSATAVVEQATAYAKARHQFGRPVGSFQAVKHHLANMLAAAELATAAAWDAARASGDDGDEGDMTFAGTVAAAVALPASVSVAQRAIQVHGGIGFTWEHPGHLYLRRAAATAGLLRTDDLLAEVATLVEAGHVRSVELDLPPEADRYRDEVRAFLAHYAALPDEERATALADSGYLFPHWPRPWGRGADSVEQLVIEQELHGVHRPNSGMAGWILPTLVAFGTPGQQEKWVRSTLAGGHHWCQLFSEPEAGSDLASLRTRAERVGGGWVVNGQKVWTSGAQHSDVGLLLARTDPEAPKHKGISCFVVAMDTPGVEVRPLREITGDSLFNEVFFTDVFVPDDQLVGELHHGWQAARTTLANERVSIGRNAAGNTPGARSLLGLAAAHHPGDRGTRREIGELLAEHHAMRLLGLRGAARAVAGADPGPEGTVLKLLASEHDQKAMDVAMRLLGPDAASAEGDGAPWVHAFLFSRCLSLGGGTSEVLRNVVAEAALGLPREPNLA